MRHHWGSIGENHNEASPTGMSMIAKTRTVDVVQRKGKPCILLMEMQLDTITEEINEELLKATDRDFLPSHSITLSMSIYPNKM